MQNNRIKENNYINIKGFMVNELGLTGDELMIYAIIFGYSQDGINYYDGGLKYLQEWTGKSKPTVIKILQNLVGKCVINKIEHYENNLKFCKYKVMAKGKENEKESKNKTAKTKYTEKSYEKIMEELMVADNVKVALFAYIKFRNMSKKMLTNDVLSDLIIELDLNFSNDDDKEKRIYDAIKASEFELFTR